MHYDFKQENLLYKNKEFFALTDFEFSHVGFICLEITKSAKYFSEDKNSHINVVKFKNFIKKYHKFYKKKINWEIYFNLLIYIILRRISHISNVILRNEKMRKIKFVYNNDIKCLKQVLRNKDKFK